MLGNMSGIFFITLIYNNLSKLHLINLKLSFFSTNGVENC